MSDVFPYSFCVIECVGLPARARGVSLVSLLLRAGFLLHSSSFDLTLVPHPAAAAAAAHHNTIQPLQQKTAHFTLVRKAEPGKNPQFDSNLIDQQIAEICKGESGVTVQIA